MPGKCHEREQVLVSVAARRTPKIVQGHSYGCPVQPTFGAFTLRRGSSLPLQKHLDCKFLGARGVFYDSRDRAGDPHIVGVKDRFEVERGATETYIATHVNDSFVLHGFVLHIHVSITPPA